MLPTNIDKNAFKKGFYKQSNFVTDAWNKGTAQTSWSHPLDKIYMGGKAIGDNVVQHYGKQLGQGASQGVMDNIKNTASGIFDKAKGAVSSLGSFAGQSFANHPLLGGLGIGALGLYGLKRLFSSNQPQQGAYGGAGGQPVYGYTPGFGPVALQKHGGMLPTALGMPNQLMQTLFGQPTDAPQQMEQSAQQPYHPSIVSRDPQLKNLAHDHKMQAYITNLIAQTAAIQKNTAL
jgi:hypothetical protein